MLTSGSLAGLDPCRVPRPGSDRMARCPAAAGAVWVVPGPTAVTLPMACAAVCRKAVIGSFAAASQGLGLALGRDGPRRASRPTWTSGSLSPTPSLPSNRRGSDGPPISLSLRSREIGAGLDGARGFPKPGLAPSRALGRFSGVWSSLPHPLSSPQAWVVTIGPSPPSSPKAWVVTTGPSPPSSPKAWVVTIGPSPPSSPRAWVVTKPSRSFAETRRSSGN